MNGRLITTLLLPAFLLCGTLYAQERTVGLIRSTPDASPGYTLFAPSQSRTTYLIDREGRIVQSWQSSYRPNQATYLLENGHLLRTGRIANAGPSNTTGGVVQEFDWDGNLLWEFGFANDSLGQHHDAIKLPSGNVLMIVAEKISPDEAIALGRDPAKVPAEGLLGERLIEVRPIGSDSGEVVWMWRALDHLVQDFDGTKPNSGTISDHPGRIDFNSTRDGRVTADWMHVNGVAYNEELDQLIFSSPTLNEVMIIDHGTTTEEAAGSTGGRRGRGGDILYRWGNPAVADLPGSQQLFFQHNPHWIPEGYPGAGNILIFNNGQRRPGGEYSSVIEIALPILDEDTYFREPGQAYGPTEPLWIYTDPVPTDFYSSFISGADRLKTGNTLICAGEQGRIFEVTPGGDVVWEYINPVGPEGSLTQGEVPDSVDTFVFRAEHYPPDYPAFAGRDMTPGEYIERYESGVEEGRSIPDYLDIE